MDEGEQVDLRDFPFLEVEALKLRIKENPSPLDFEDLYLTE